MGKLECHHRRRNFWRSEAENLLDAEQSNLNVMEYFHGAAVQLLDLAANARLLAAFDEL